MKKLFLLLVAIVSIALAASAQTRTVTGTVVDATNDDPLIGASVTPAGTNSGAITDVNGHFTLHISPSVKELTVSYVGYNTKTVKVEDKLYITLDPAAETLETVVVTGYGSGKKLGSVVGSVAVVGDKALANVTTPSFVDALQGQVAGLSVFSSSGDPSSTENNIRMRGVNSIYLSNTPLFILDGAPVTQAVFATLNPNDIESITVLKDASAVAIYGSRAANGVIVVTSKKGRYAEKASVNIRIKGGFSQLSDDPVEMMNSDQYIKYRNLIGQPVNDEMIYAAETLGIDTNWRDQIFSSHAPTYSLEASITGGGEATNYYISLNHMDQQGIIEASGMRRETLRLNIATRATEWLRVGLQTNLGYTKYQVNTESNAIYNGGDVYLSNPMMTARAALPMDSPYYWVKGEDGKVEWLGKADYLHFTGMALPSYYNKWRDQWRNKVTVNANIFEEITPIDGLTLRAQQSLDALDYRGKGAYKAHYMQTTPMGDVFDVPSDGSDLNTGNNSQIFQRYYQFTYTNTAEYRKRINGVHNLTFLIGQESIINNQEGFSASSVGQYDARLPFLDQGTDTSMARLGMTSLLSKYTINSYFVSFSYNYADKYFFDGTFRRDGSSKFAPNHKWSSFWSVGAMWDIKQEKFMKNYKWIDTARVRLSYGTTGNSSISPYAFYGTVSDGSAYMGNGSISVSSAPNPDLTWEKVSGLDFGIDFGLFNKVKLEVDYYDKTTSDMILVVPYSYTTGVGGALGNIGSMVNRGVDLDIHYTPVNTRDWLWEIRANMNYNYNEITKLYNDLDEVVLTNTGLILKKDHRANEFYMVRFAGVDPRDGQQMWYTKEGNITKVYNEERDAVATGKTSMSPIGGGFGTSVGWKGLTLGVDFTWAANKYMIDNDRYFFENNNFATSFNQCAKMLEVWTKPGDITDIPAPGQTIQFDTHLLENASFLRLKTLTLQYRVPRSILSKIKLDGLAFHAVGRNLLTFTNYTGYDPEPESNVVAFFYPNTRQFEFGVDISF